LGRMLRRGSTTLISLKNFQPLQGDIAGRPAASGWLSSLSRTFSHYKLSRGPLLSLSGTYSRCKASRNRSYLLRYFSHLSQNLSTAARLVVAAREIFGPSHLSQELAATARSR